MKKITMIIVSFVVLLVVLLVVIVVSKVSSPVDSTNATINNTIHWLDTSGEPIKAQGGNIIKAGKYYYMVGVDFPSIGTVPTTDYAGYNAVKVYRSTDLANWEFRSNVIYPGVSGWPTNLTDATKWVGRPSILYNDSTNKYVLITHMEGAMVSATSDTPDGNYTYAKTMTLPKGVKGAPNDISCFQDGDNGYFVANIDQEEGARIAAIFKLTSDYLDFDSQTFRDSVPYETEAYHLVKKDDLWYWFASGLYYWYSTPTSYRTSASLEGPWGAYQFVDTSPNQPIMWDKLDSFNTQHDFIIPVTGTQGTTYVYFGDTYSQYTGIGDRYNAAFPITWNGTVPVLNGYEQWQIDTAAGTWSVAEE